MEIVVAGHIVIDEVLDPGAGEVPRLCLGGPVSYSSICLSSLGYNCTMVTKFGSDLPAEYRQLLSKHAKIQLYQNLDSKSKTTHYRIDRRYPGEHRKLFLKSRSSDLRFEDFFTSLNDNPKSKTVIANTVAGEISLDLLRRLVITYGRVLVDSQGFVRDIPSSPGKEVCLVKGGLDLSMLDGVCALKADAEELLAWTGLPNQDLAIAEISKHVKSLLLTAGGGPLEYYENGFRRFTATPFNVDPVDTTGAGDIFLAAYAARISEGVDVTGALKFAISAATMSVTKTGILKAILSKDEIMQRCDSIVVKEWR